MTDYGDAMETETPKAAQSMVPDKVFDNPAVQERWARTVQQIAWGLIGLAGGAMLGVFVLALFGGGAPDTIVLLGTTVATGCISGLVGYIAGRNSGEQGGA